MDKQQIKKDWVSCMEKNVSMDEIVVDLPESLERYSFIGFKYKGFYKMRALGCLGWVLDQHELAYFNWIDWNNIAWENEKLDGFKMLVSYIYDSPHPRDTGYNFTRLLIEHLNIFTHHNVTIQEMLKSEKMIDNILKIKA